ncbi:hypothetical protein PIB30_107166, partial [Stylosanthes scabra]|nr:hypothetical protein [Stylosanthes scabra]
MRGPFLLKSSKATPTPRRAPGSLGVALTLQPAPEPTHRRRTPSICVEVIEPSPKDSRPTHRRGSPRLCVETTKFSPEPHEAHAYAWNSTHMRGKQTILGQK